MYILYSYIQYSIGICPAIVITYLVLVILWLKACMSQLIFLHNQSFDFHIMYSAYASYCSSIAQKEKLRTCSGGQFQLHVTHTYSSRLDVTILPSFHDYITTMCYLSEHIFVSLQSYYCFFCTLPLNLIVLILFQFYHYFLNVGWLP